MAEDDAVLQDDAALEPPMTGNASVDAALALAAGPAEEPLAQRYERLRAAQEALGAVLDGAAATR